jgi:hypothetical protein
MIAWRRKNEASPREVDYTHADSGRLPVLGGLPQETSTTAAAATATAAGRAYRISERKS